MTILATIKQVDVIGERPSDSSLCVHTIIDTRLICIAGQLFIGWKGSMTPYHAVLNMRGVDWTQTAHLEDE